MWKTPVLLFAVLSAFSCQDVENEVVKVVAAATPGELEAEGPGQRIIGGTLTTIEKYPYVVQVWHNNMFKCGGSLLTTRHVLSSAHCFVNSNGQLISNRQFTIRAGTVTLNSGGQTRSVSRIINHEGYNMPHRDNDISILVLSRPVTLSATVNLAALGSTAPPDNATVWYVGWGATFFSLNPNVIPLSERLQEVAVNVVNLNTCASYYHSLNLVPGTEFQRPFVITNNMICAGALGLGGRDACTGDSGGPVISNGLTVGVTSWGYRCGDPYYPGVNTRVANYIQWINNTVTRNGSTAIKASAVMLLASIISALRLR